MLGMSVVQTRDLKLFYFDPLDFLTPHAVRTYTNSLAWQRRIFGWTPSEPTTILLKDFADYGNAAAGVAPHDRLIFDVAPQSRAFETFPASERIVSLMNHEMVHIAQGDISSTADRRWRRLFFGKVAAQAQYPESLLYNYHISQPKVFARFGALIVTLVFIPRKPIVPTSCLSASYLIKLYSLDLRMLPT